MLSCIVQELQSAGRPIEMHNWERTGEGFYQVPVLSIATAMLPCYLAAAALQRCCPYESSPPFDRQYEYTAGARRFDGGQRSNFITLPAAAASL